MDSTKDNPSTGQPNASQEASSENCALGHYNKKTVHETVDQLILELLNLIETLVDHEPVQPLFLLQTITQNLEGWLELVKSLIRVVPLEHPMGLDVTILALNNSPPPNEESVHEVTNMVAQTRNTHEERNFCMILGWLAQYLTGPRSIAMLSETILTYLLDNLQEQVNPDVQLMSLITLEKFAKASENNPRIKEALAKQSPNPLERLEQKISSTDFIVKQVAFCARWCLDNCYSTNDRENASNLGRTSNVKVALSKVEVGEILKISPDGLEFRYDGYNLGSVRCSFEVNSGCWYYEVLVITPGVMQIGWAITISTVLNEPGCGFGDDKYSIAFDGCRRLIWHDENTIKHQLPAWSPGSILGCLLDIDNKEVVFSLDGTETVVFKEVFENAIDGSSFFAAASIMAFQQCRFNFGAENFRYPPKNKNFRSFNENAEK